MGAITGVQFWVTGRLQETEWSFYTVLRHQTLAGLPWIPLTYAVAAVVRRFPFRTTSLPAYLAIHLTAAASTAFLYNLLIACLWWFAGTPFAPGPPQLEQILLGTLRWIHIVVLTYGALAAGVEWLDSRGRKRDRVSDSPEVEATRSGAGPSVEPVAQTTTPLVLRAGTRQIRLLPDQIDCLEAEGDYVRVRAEDSSHLVNHRLAELADQLATAGFVRIHRSTVVNLQRIRSVHPIGRGDREVVLADGTRRKVARGRVAELERRLATPGGCSSG